MLTVCINVHVCSKKLRRRRNDWRDWKRILLYILSDSSNSDRIRFRSKNFGLDRDSDFKHNQLSDCNRPIQSNPIQCTPLFTSGEDNIFTHSLHSFVKYCFQHLKIKQSISLHQYVISSIYYGKLDNKIAWLIVLLRGKKMNFDRLTQWVWLKMKKTKFSPHPEKDKTKLI